MLRWVLNMSEVDADKICKILKEKLMQPETPKKPTGNIIIFLQTGGVSGNIKLELVL